MGDIGFIYLFLDNFKESEKYLQKGYDLQCAIDKIAINKMDVQSQDQD